jgi:inner membrane protein
LIVLGILTLLLLVPLGMVESVVRERHATYRGVVDEIAGSWSGEQLLAGPFLIVPFVERVEVTDEYLTMAGEKRTETRWEEERRRAVVLPSDLGIDGVITPEIRRRGIYEVQVFTADLVVSGSFGGVDERIRSLVPPDRFERVEWEQAVVVFGLDDPRGVVNVDGLSFNGHPGQARPGTTLGRVVPKGFHVAVGSAVADEMDFRMPMVVRGSDSLRFLPLGESTRVVLSSRWPHPSFLGDVLPTSRTVNGDGFEGEWTISLLNRSFPQVWAADTEMEIREIDAGVRLFEPVALYDLVTRAVKYGLLFVVLTFLTLGLVELVTGARLSPVQFLLIGVGLALFFLILVALAEHMGFTTAYLLASAAVVIINTAYCAAILPRRRLSLVVGAVLTAVYGVLYTILEAEDYALLGGTVLLVIALSVTMYFTRRLHLASDD